MGVMVTGANGFIGQALVRRLVQEGHSVIGAIRGPVESRRGYQDGHPIYGHPWSTGYLTPKGTACQRSVAEQTAFKWVTIEEIGPDTRWEKALEGVETVVHLAARVHVRDQGAAAIRDFYRVNVDGSVTLAQEAAAAGVRRFIYMSSIKVNGEATADGEAFKEEDQPKPEGPYAKSKWEAEQRLNRLAGETGLELVVVRPPLVYGPGVKGNFLSLLDVVNKSRVLPLGRINNKRSFVYIGNLVDAIVTAIYSDKAVGRTLLISDGSDVSTPDLIRLISGGLRARTRLINVPVPILRFGGRVLRGTTAIERLVSSLVVNSTEIRRVLGWISPYTLQDGLRWTCEWYRCGDHPGSR